MFVVEMDNREVQASGTRFLSTLSRGTKDALRKEAETSQKRLADGTYWKNHSRKLARSFKIIDDPELISCSVRSGSAIAKFLNKGTKAHTIRPKLGAGFVGPAQLGQGRRKTAGGPSVVRFVVGGRVLFRRSVKHPGTKALNFMAAEAALAAPRAHAAVDRAADRAAEQAGFR